MSVNVKTLYADATEITDLETTAKDVAKTLKLDSGALLKQLTEAKELGRRYVQIAKKLDESAVQKSTKPCRSPT
jgi:hypothetical protein